MICNQYDEYVMFVCMSSGGQGMKTGQLFADIHLL